MRHREAYNSLLRIKEANPDMKGLDDFNKVIQHLDASATWQAINGNQDESTTPFCAELARKWPKSQRVR